MPLVSKSFSDIITFTRASSGTYFDATGTLQTATTNNARFDYNPSTLAARGMLVEEQRTNSIRNNTMVGAVAGTPGTLPQVSGSESWAITGVPAGITRTIVGTGTENGVTYIDIQLSGTPGASADIQIFPETSPGVAATASQAWASSFYVKLAAGTTTNVSSWRLNLVENSSVPAFLRQTSTNINAPTSSSLATQRVSASITTGASTAFVQSSILFSLTSGAAIDITLRIGLPQLEQGAFATSVISTSTAAATRSADVASVNTLSPWYNASAGTLYAEYSVSGYSTSSAFPSALALSDTTNNNRLNIANTNIAANLYPYGEVASGGVSQAGLYGASTGAAFGIDTVRKAALAYTANDFAFTTQGLSVQTDTSGTVPVVSRLYLGVGSTGSTSFIGGYLRRVTYYPRRLSNAELQGITT